VVSVALALPHRMSTSILVATGRLLYPPGAAEVGTKSEAGPRATCRAQRRSAGKQQSGVSAAGRSKRHSAPGLGKLLDSFPSTSLSGRESAPDGSSLLVQGPRVKRLIQG